MAHACELRCHRRGLRGAVPKGPATAEEAKAAARFTGSAHAAGPCFREMCLLFYVKVYDSFNVVALGINFENSGCPLVLERQNWRLMYARRKFGKMGLK